MAAAVEYVTALCLLWSCISVAFPAAIPAHERPLDPDHVPSSVCESMIPEHGNHDPSTDPAPYTVTPSKLEVAPGETIQVSINGKNGAKFRGLYLQARVDDGTEAVGKFSLNNQLINSAIRVSSCPPGSENAISYVSRDAIDSLLLDWKAPETATGRIHFRSTIVETFSKFWIDVNSETFEVMNSAQSA